MAFLDIAAGISALTAAGASSFTTVYGALEGSKLAKRQAALQEQLALSEMSINRDLADSQKNIFLIQQEGLRKSQNIDLRIKEAQAGLEIKRINDQMKVNYTPKKESPMQKFILVGSGLLLLGVALSFFRRD